MVNKLQFNNLVISNKKGIQQARIQTINKLVHKIRKLKTLLEKHPDNTKSKERVRKSTETIELLKKLKRVDIMKNILLMDKPPAAIITNGLATPNEVGVALLAMNKVMQGLIKRFKSELQLKNEDSDKWKDDLKETSKRRQKIERTEEKRKKRLEMKEQKAMGRKRQEWLEQNQAEDGEAKLDPDAEVSTVGKWKIEELKTEEKITATGKKNEKKKVPDLKRPLKENHTKKKKGLPNEKVKKEDVLLKGNEIQNKYSDDEGEKKVTQKNASDKGSEDEEKLQDFSYINDERNDEPDDSEKDCEETLVFDPFFITDTGENYLSSAVIKRGQNAKSENNEDNKDLHIIKLNNNKKQNDFKERRQQSKDTKQQNYRAENNQTREKYPHQQNKWNIKANRDQKYQHNKWNNQNDKFKQKLDSKERDNNKNQRDQNLSTGKMDLNLHPSWAAKQKLKPVITNFQGKKITFGDDDNNSNLYTQPQSNNSKKQASKSINIERDSLHPSWAAKQKLKPTINVFQGKKITFENDD